MAALNLLVPSVSNILSFHNLALFICHLFIGGQFRNGHILYDPKVFNDDFPSRIDSICPAQIPWLLTDITQPSSLPWLFNERTDHILQLIFFDPEHLAEKIDKFSKCFTFYRVFVLASSINGIDEMKRNSIISQKNPTSTSNTLIVHFDTQNGSLQVHGISSRGGNLKELIDERHEDEFDRAFGEHERMQSTTIRTTGIFNGNQKHKTFIPISGHLFFANYFLTSLNASYINMTLTPVSDLNAFTHQAVRRKQRKFHQELSIEYESIDDQNV